ncbi:MAG: PQQ-dependent sugar dehydrogenase [Flavobacteriales bacterium]|nr:PQQ-dependent sugar dehydrogenase [Flavobacteriales bacterium]
MNKFFIALAALAGICCQSSTVEAQPTWTVGNTTLTETDLVTGVSLPWEILWGPDDYIWCSTRPGLVLRIDPETGNYETVLDLTDIIFDEGSGEPGMLGMALYPNWDVLQRVFIVYCHGSGFNVSERLSAFDYSDGQLVNEQILIDEIPAGYIHDGSRIIITSDFKIMMTTGDTGDGGDSSQDLDAINGKVLRVNLDGSIPSDNPDPSSYVWSYGHRNGQGLCVGPTGIIYESEHGQNASDEFNIIEPGRNYGWPNVQGACNTMSEQTYCTENNVKEPLKEWTPCVAVNGISYYNHPAIPEWENSIIMGVMGGLGGANGNNDRVSVLHLSDDGLTVESEDQYFTSLNQRFRDVCINPYNGCLYVALNGSQYPGNGPNKIKAFCNLDFDSGLKPENQGPTQSISLYPNPAGNEIHVNVTPELVGQKLSVYAYSGALVLESVLENGDSTLDISALPGGNYWVKASSALGTVTSNFSKN